MTRKDYELIAAAIKATVVDHATGIAMPDRERAAVAATAQSIAGALATDNPLFDQARFLRACGF